MMDEVLAGQKVELKENKINQLYATGSRSGCWMHETAFRTVLMEKMILIMHLKW